MKIKNAPKYAKKDFLILSLFLVLCLPLIVWQVVSENFDLRDLAFQEVEVSEEYPCVISFPNVNPYTLAVGKTVRMQVEGIAQGPGITSVVITDSTGEEIYLKEYDTSETEIAETFEFTPKESKPYEIMGTLSEGTYDTACVISSPYDVKGVRAVADNKAPEFTSTPLDSEPSQNIDTEITYEYTLTATDPENDFINYVFSFTPNNRWLKYTVIKDGSNGELKIQFKGSTSEPASYLANVFIHDGYSKHLRSQSWIISVNPAENDIPRVTILSPWQAITVSQGDPLSIKWASTDRNAITHYELYLAQSIQDENSWYPIDKDIAYNLEEYTVDTEEISAGTYKAIVQATDNQEPPLTGRGISPIIEIIGEEFDMPDDDIRIPEPQIINVTPSGEEGLTNRLVTIRASLVASQGAEIIEDSIVAKVDGIDITEKAKFNRISDAEWTLIYQTEEEFDPGLHKVEISFTDSTDLEAEKSWTFNIVADQRDPDKFYFFGYAVSKTIVYVIAGGLLLLVLALIVPLILVRIWKEDEETVERDDTLKPPQPTDTVKQMVNQTTDDTTFGKLESPPRSEVPELQDEEPKNLQQPKEKAGGDIKMKIIEAKEQKAREEIIDDSNSSKPESIPTTTLDDGAPPEPDEDLKRLYEKISNQKEQESSPEEPTE